MSALKVFGITVLIAFLVSTISNEVLAGIVLGAILSIFSFTLIFFLSSKLIRVIEEIYTPIKNTNGGALLFSIVKFIKTIRRYLILAFIANVLLSALSVYFYYTADQSYNPGEFSLLHLAPRTLTLTNLVILCIIAWYVNSVTVGAIYAEMYPKYCYIFRRWDAKNLVLIPDKSDEINEAILATTIGTKDL